jgi:hypothetical protein
MPWPSYRWVLEITFRQDALSKADTRARARCLLAAGRDRDQPKGVANALAAADRLN